MSLEHERSQRAGVGPRWSLTLSLLIPHELDEFLLKGTMYSLLGTETECRLSLSDGEHGGSFARFEAADSDVLDALAEALWGLSLAPELSPDGVVSARIRELAAPHFRRYLSDLRRRIRSIELRLDGDAVIGPGPVAESASSRGQASEPTKAWCDVSITPIIDDSLSHYGSRFFRRFFNGFGEFDQRLTNAFDIARRISRDGVVDCLGVTAGVFATNPTCVASLPTRRHVNAVENAVRRCWDMLEQRRVEPPAWNPTPEEGVRVSAGLALALESMGATSSSRANGTVAVEDFLSIMFHVFEGVCGPYGGWLEAGQEDILLFPKQLAKEFGPVSRERFAKVLEVGTMLGAGRSRDSPVGDDIAFVLALNPAGILTLRPASVLGDYGVAGRIGPSPCRAILTHLKDQLGRFTEEDICELEALLNSKSTKEASYQAFFEKHPHFFRRWDYREVHPQICLRSPDGQQYPDFLLINRDAQRAAVLELKLPTPMLIRRQRNRDRFASAVCEARAQLLRYRDWFRERANRHRLVPKIGMEVYEPELIVVIGRSSDFEGPLDRQRLTADYPDIEIATYDDILQYAKARRILVEMPQEKLWHWR